MVAGSYVAINARKARAANRVANYGLFFSCCYTSTAFRDGWDLGTSGSLANWSHAAQSLISLSCREAASGWRFLVGCCGLAIRGSARRANAAYSLVWAASRIGASRRKIAAAS